MYFLIIHECICLKFDDFFILSCDKFNLRGHRYRLELKNCRTDVAKSSFANRCIKCWNSLPENVVNSNSVDIFKSRLKKIDFSDFMGRT